jgi:mercuric ion transport protein
VAIRIVPMTRVELIYSRDCPNVDETRARLRRAFATAGMTARWVEHVIGEPDVPEHARGYGSPTIFVDGRDVAGEMPHGEQCCRIYAEGTERRGTPPLGMITAALLGAPGRARFARETKPPP